MDRFDIEIAVAEYFNPRQNIIVPNVSWGISLHECDLLVLTPRGYAWEIEIKVNASDIRADRKKCHEHRDNRISRLYFAVPEEFRHNADIPARAGILAVKYLPDLYDEWKQKHADYYRVEKIRDAQVEKREPWSLEDRLKLLRLGYLRTWTLRKKIRELKKAKEET